MENENLETTYAVVDVETGGFSKTKNGLCEVAIIIIDQNFKKVEEFSTLIHPYLRPDSDELVSYKDDAMAVNGINLDDLKNAPEAAEAAVEIEYVLKENNVTTIVAHNAKSMDKVWIEFFLERFGTGFKFNETICTLVLARSKKLPVENNKLGTLLEHFGIVNKDNHRALGDAESTYHLWIELINIPS